MRRRVDGGIAHRHRDADLVGTLAGGDRRVHDRRWLTREAPEMFCPRCGEEYPWDVMVCLVCDVDTVDRLPGPEPTPDAELVRVFTTGDAGLIAIAKSLLDGEEIDYLVRG